MSHLAAIFKKKMFIRSCNLDDIVEKYYQQPTEAWNILESSQIVRRVEPLEPSTPKPPGHTRFGCISDTHSLNNPVHPIPDGDVLIHAGDFTMVGRTKEIREFNEFLTSLSHPHKVVIAGNHDIAFDLENYETLYPYWKFSLKEKVDSKEAKKLLDSTKCTYLEDSEVTINGLRIYGTPWYVDDDEE
jgi:predicted MPP superfamily phosphohydrolase